LGDVFCAFVAGGGFKGGHVVGASDAKGEQVRDRPVYPAISSAASIELLGIDADGKLPNSQGLDVRMTPTLADGHQMAAASRRFM